MLIRHPLPHGGLVVKLPDSLYEGLVKWDFAKYDALLFRLPRSISRIGPDLIIPPMVKGSYWQNGIVVPFHGVIIFRRTFRQTLHKREQIDPRSTSPEPVKQGLRIVEKVVPIRLEPRSPEQSPLNPDLPVANFYQ